MATFVSDCLEARKNGGQARFSVVRRAVKLNVSNGAKHNSVEGRKLPLTTVRYRVSQLHNFRDQ
jgi:hypothetical protein